MTPTPATTPYTQALETAKQNALAVVGHRFSTPQAAEAILDVLIATAQSALPVPPVATSTYLWKEDADVVRQWHRAFIADGLSRTEELNALCTLVQNRVEGHCAAPVARSGEDDGSLSVNADAIEVRQRFDVLMERMDEFYPEQGMWDAQVVAFYLVQEARLHVDVLRALCGEAAQCTADVDNDAARELTVRLNQAWRGEDPVGAAASPAPSGEPNQALDDIGVDDGPTDGHAISVHRSSGPSREEVEAAAVRYAKVWAFNDDEAADALTALLALYRPAGETDAVNQCDGCREGLPLTDGLHYRDGKAWIGCTAARYAPAGETRAGDARELLRLLAGWRSMFTAGLQDMRLQSIAVSAEVAQLIADTNAALHPSHAGDKQ